MNYKKFDKKKDWKEKPGLILTWDEIKQMIKEKHHFILIDHKDDKITASNPFPNEKLPTEEQNLINKIQENIKKVFIGIELGFVYIHLFDKDHAGYNFANLKTGERIPIIVHKKEFDPKKSTVFLPKIDFGLDRNLEIPIKEIPKEFFLKKGAIITDAKDLDFEEK